MSTRPHTERDPLPDEEHRPVSSTWARRAALEATAAAVKAAKEARNAKFGEKP